jgi:hypothetical protein
LKLPPLEDGEREITRDEVAKCYPELLPDLDEVLAGKRTNTRLFLSSAGYPLYPLDKMGAPALKFHITCLCRTQ